MTFHPPQASDVLIDYALKRTPTDPQGNTWVSRVPCPLCERFLSTDGKGRFTCLCGHAEEQEVKHYRDLAAESGSSWRQHGFVFGRRRDDRSSGAT